MVRNWACVAVELQAHGSQGEQVLGTAETHPVILVLRR